MNFVASSSMYLCLATPNPFPRGLSNSSWKLSSTVIIPSRMLSRKSHKQAQFLLGPKGFAQEAHIPEHTEKCYVSFDKPLHCLQLSVEKNQQTPNFLGSSVSSSPLRCLSANYFPPLNHHMRKQYVGTCKLSKFLDLIPIAAQFNIPGT